MRDSEFGCAMGMEHLQRLADAAGYATASHDDLTPWDDVDQATRLSRLSASRTPDDPKPRSSSGTALVPVKPLWQSTTDRPSVSAGVTRLANTAVRSFASSIVRGLPARA